MGVAGLFGEKLGFGVLLLVIGFVVFAFSWSAIRLVGWIGAGFFAEEQGAQ